MAVVHCRQPAQYVRASKMTPYRVHASSFDAIGGARAIMDHDCHAAGYGAVRAHGRCRGAGATVGSHRHRWQDRARRRSGSILQVGCGATVFQKRDRVRLLRRARRRSQARYRCTAAAFGATARLARANCRWSRVDRREAPAGAARAVYAGRVWHAVEACLDGAPLHSAARHRQYRQPVHRAVAGLPDVILPLG